MNAKMASEPVIKQTEVRALGKTEANWCAAVETGTGITITSILFDRRVPVADLKQSLRSLLAIHPRLRSVIFQDSSRELIFRTPEEVYVRLTETDETPDETHDTGDQEQSWHSITEKELNTPFSKHYPIPVFEPKLYYLVKDESSLLVLRVHAAAADMASTGTMVKQIVSSLIQRNNEETVRVSSNAEQVVLPSIEDGIPPGQAKKPFWAHGVDVLGYGLSSRRHAYLPFDDCDAERTSKLIRAALTANATSLLLKVPVLFEFLFFSLAEIDNYYSVQSLISTHNI